MANFLFNKVHFIMNTDCFLEHHYHIYIEKEGEQVIRAYEVDNSNKSEHIKSTIGEFFEREVLINNNPISYNECQMISMVTGNKILFPVSELVFENKFVDSCGMASHTLSSQLIWKAFKENFERQSYISSVLFHLSAIEVDIESSCKLCNIHNYLKNYLDHVKYYNISLSNNIFVVLAIGYSNNTKAAGLGTSRNIELAVEKAQKEMLQYFAVSSNKYNRKNKSKHQNANEIDNKDIYHERFEAMSVKTFRDSYAYLEKNSRIALSELAFPKVMEMNLMIKDNFIKLNMEPYIALFNGRENSGVKIAKIKDFNWFPHMNPKLYKKDLILSLERKFGWKRKNFNDWLPFA